MDEYARDSPDCVQSVAAINSILKILELRFDEDEEVQRQKQALGQVLARVHRRA